MIEELALHGGPAARRTKHPTWPVFDDSERAALLNVMNSGEWGRLAGDVTARVETEFAALTTTKHAVAVNSGQTALRLAILALDPPAGAEIICPAYTFIATAMSIVEANCVPVFADIESSSLCLDAKSVESVVTDRTIAIMPVHLGGVPTDMDALLDVAKRHKLSIIEDASHAHLSTWKERQIGSIGSIGCFSLQASKNLNCGEGGLITTNDSTIYARLSALQNNGRMPGDKDRYRHAMLGGNYRMTEFQAAILGCQLERLPSQTAHRFENGLRLNTALMQIAGFSPLPSRVGETCNAYHLYCFAIDSSYFGVPRDVVLSALRAEGVSCGPGYATLVYEHDAFTKGTFGPYTGASVGYTSSLDVNRAKCPVSEIVAHQTGAWLPMTELMSDHQGIDEILAAFSKVSRLRNQFAIIG
ncbi:MAG: DegT/DnrJ/EryC1/StrS family aminotransferase [Armatimonadota bacterium]